MRHLVKKIALSTMAFLSIFMFTNMMKPGPAMELRQEIQLLNLVNGLDLSKEQILQILPLLEEAQQSREIFFTEVENLQAELKPLLEKLRDDLRENIAPDDKLREEIRMKKAPMRELREEFISGQKEIAQKIFQVFTEDQRTQLKNFKPCILPPGNNQELRIGQTGNNRRAGFMLDRIRELPDDVFEEHLENILNRAVRRTQRHNPENFDENSFKQNLEATLRQARSLTQAEYQLEKDNLIQSLRPQHGKNSIRGRKKHMMMLARHLFNPKMIDILRDRLQDLGGTSPANINR